MALWVIIVGFVIGFALAFAIGANDVANSFGTSVGSKVLTLRKACILASIFETAGAVLLGAKVSSTISKGIIDVNLYADDVAMLELGYLAALIGAFVWLFAATWLKLPVSGTHSIVGSVIGFTLVAKGASGVNWLVLVKIVCSWFISPVFSGAVSALIYFFLQTTILKIPDHRSQLERGVLLLPFFYAITLAVNAFSVLHDGPRIPFLAAVPLWATILISILIGIVSGIIARILIAPKLRVDIINRRPTLSNIYKLPGYKPELVDARTSYHSADFAEKQPVQDTLPPSPMKTVFPRLISVESTLTTLTEETANHDDEIPSKDSELPLVAQNSKHLINDEEFEETTGNRTATFEYAGVFQLFAMLQILTACFGAFAHGGNDVSNAVGPVVGLWSLYNGQPPNSMKEPEVWILCMGGVGISLGLWILGRRVIETVGSDLTPVTPPSGFSIELGAAMTVLVASQAYVPVSTTHCKIGSVVSVGIVRGGRKEIDWKIFRNIIMAWLITVPASGAVAAAIMWLLKTVAYDPSMSNQLLLQMTTFNFNQTNTTTLIP